MTTSITGNRSDVQHY